MKFLKVSLILVLLMFLASGFVYASNIIPIFIDGREIESDVAPQLTQGRTMVPVRVITENFGAEVEWLQDSRSVEITSPYQKFLRDYKEKGMYVKQAEEVLSMVKAQTAVILDVRSEAVRVEGYIMGSIHIPIDMLLEQIDNIPVEKAIAVYCSKNINASYAVAILNMLGYEAYLLENGIDAWKSVGGRTSTCGL